MRPRQTILITFLVLALLLAGCGSSPAPVVVEPTVTPLAAGDATATAVPAAAITAERLAMLDAAQADISSGRFSDALDRLSRAAVLWPDDQEISQRTAEAYLTWGKAMLGEANGDGTQIEFARERLISGLAQAPEASQIATDITAEIGRTDQLLALSEIVRDLKQLAAQPSEQAAQRAAELVGGMDQAATQLGDSAALPLLLYDGLIAAGDALKGGGQSEQGCTLYERAAGLQGVDVQSARERLSACEAEQATPTARPTPTNTPVTLVQIPDVRGADPGAAQKYLEERGFRVALTQITDGSQIAGLCKQMVSYTAPKGGVRAPRGSQVRIFYRGFDSFASPANCPEGR